MPEQNIIVPTNNVEGNITTCKIEKVRVLTKKNSVFSLKETNTYQTYDVCNKTVIQEYTLPEFTNLGVGFLGLGFLILIIIVVKGLAKIFDK